MSDQPKKTSDLAILGINLGAFVIYTFLDIYVGHDGGWFILALLHAAACVIVAIAMRRWVWVLAGILILVIGCATCVNTFHLDTK